jgi:hypothetical protein
MTWWRSAQIVVLIATVALLAALITAPSTGLTLLWDVAVPLLPAVFLIQPGIWRNICPLATLSMLPNRPRGGLILNGRGIPVAGTLGMVLLLLMVPARRFLFNTDGAALAVTIVGVAVLAMMLGSIFDKKAGFCSGICPVLPVERLYGQSPFLTVANARCHPCTMCTTRGCLDIAGSKSIAQTMGPERKSHAWLYTGFGIFAASFPGFVVGYNLTQDGPLSSALLVYGTVLASAGVSWSLTQAIVLIFGIGSATALRGLALLSLGLYYWFAADTVTTHLALPDWTPATIRTAAFLLLGWWLVRALWPAARATHTGTRPESPA